MKRTRLSEQFPIGAVSHRLTVTEHLGPNRNGDFVVVCRCECGSVKRVNASNLRSENTKSCGCLHAEHVAKVSLTHGHCAGGKDSGEYNAWCHMQARCDNPKNPDFHNYGGRGITVCKKWRDSFQAFYEDMGPRPSPDHSIDRKNNHGNYTKQNCRWATRTEQARNKRTNTVNEAKVRRIRSLVARGLTRRQVSDLMGINYHNVKAIAYGSNWRDIV